MTCDSFRKRGGGGVRKTHVSQDDRRNNGIVVTHANVALELAVLLSEGLCAGVELGLAERGDGGIANGGSRYADGCGDGGRQEVVKGIITKLGEHEGGLMVVWTDVPVGEGVEGVKERGGALGCHETPRMELGALRDGG